MTYEQFRGYWPQQKDDSTGITAHLNSVSKYVVSHTMQEPAWENTTVLRGPLKEEVERLKREPGGEIGVTGSISVVHSLIAAGAVDQYRLFVYPVVLGRGARLFQDARQVGKLGLVVSGLRIRGHTDELSITLGMLRPTQMEMNGG